VVGTLLGRGSLSSARHFWGHAYGAAASNPCGPERGFGRAGALPVLVFFLVRRFAGLRRANILIRLKYRKRGGGTALQFRA